MLDILNQKIDAQSSVFSDYRPVIGISCNRKDGTSCVAEPYFQSVVMAGGAPVLLPVTTDIGALTAVIDQLDGLILSGGGDIDPAFLGEEIAGDADVPSASPVAPTFLGEKLSGYADVLSASPGKKPTPKAGRTDILRDEYDFIVLRLAFNRQMPIFGICRGHQVINVAFGGSIYQDIATQYPKTSLEHNPKEARDKATHTVILVDTPSRLRTAFNAALEIPVNSFHHQAVKALAPEFMATALSPDGLNEAMEHTEYTIFSVQWHPEPMAAAGNKKMLGLFRYHIQQASIFAKAKKLHDRIVTIDSHTDTPMLAQTFDLGRKEGGKVNLPFMREGRLDAVFMVAYVPQGARDSDALQQATHYTVERLSTVIEQVKKYHSYMEIAKSVDDLQRLKQMGKKAVFLGIENGYAIGKDLDNLQKFKEIGVSYLTLCHNSDNDICDASGGQAEWGGLSPFGREAVAAMNRLGLMIDVSHAAMSTFYDVLGYSTKPVIASHSSARALCDHPRNLDDDQLRALAAKGGVVQLCLYKRFITKDAEKASLSDAIRHLCHIIDVAGIDHAGIGSDFDGDGELTGCRAANELIQITMRLIAEGFDEASIAKIWGGNLLRVMSEQLTINN